MKNIFIVLMGLVSFSAFAQTAAPELTYWYERPQYPGDGVYVSTEGQVLSIQIKGNQLTYKLGFSAKDDEFIKHGGWMVDIESVQGQMRLISESEMVNDSYYGVVFVPATVFYQNKSSSDFNNMSCLQRKKDQNIRRINCFLNGFDSFSFEIQE